VVRLRAGSGDSGSGGAVTIELVDLRQEAVYQLVQVVDQVEMAVLCPSLVVRVLLATSED
jgi:hypothetical protein